jgi:hypothetical protein
MAFSAHPWNSILWEWEKPFADRVADSVTEADFEEAK